MRTSRVLELLNSEEGGFVVNATCDDRCPSEAAFFGTGTTCCALYPGLRFKRIPRWNDVLRFGHHDYRVTKVYGRRTFGDEFDEPFVAMRLVRCHHTSEQEIARLDAAQRCLDCQEIHVPSDDPKHAMFMTQRDVWEQYVPEGPNVLLCFACLEKRMGRRLEPADFTSVPINAIFFALHPEYG